MSAAQSPIQFHRSADGTYELTYFGKVVGWARRARYPTRPGEVLFRAVSIHGEVRHTQSLIGARAALLEMYH